MCIAAIAFAAHPHWRVVAIANRDEVHDRPTAPLARWAGGNILAGRDLRSGGTWLGVSDESASGGAGRLVLVTNHRVPGFPLPHRPSRGGLVTELLAGAEPAHMPIADYNPFNLAVISASGAAFLANHPDAQHRALGPGIHGLSNGPLRPPWPKTRQLCADLTHWLEAGGTNTAPLFAALARESLPDTALDLSDPDPARASAFIRNPVYGTRCSTVVTIDRHGHGQIIERRFSATGEACGDTALGFAWAE